MAVSNNFTAKVSTKYIFDTPCILYTSIPLYILYKDRRKGCKNLYPADDLNLWTSVQTCVANKKLKEALWTAEMISDTRYR